MENPKFLSEQEENYEKKITDTVIKIDEEIRQFGGVQKYVLLESKEGYVFGTFPYLSHPEIVKQIQERVGGELENKGGGFLNFFNGEVEIGERPSFNIGPLQIAREELVHLLEGKIDGYKIKLSE